MKSLKTTLIFPTLHYGVIVFAAQLTLVFLGWPTQASAQMSEAIRLEVRGTNLLSLQDAGRILVSSHDNSQLSILDTSRDDPPKVVKLGHLVLVSTLGPDGRYAYLLGPAQGERGNSMMVLSQFDVSDHSVRRIEFEARLQNPSLFVGRKGQIYFSDVGSNRVWEIPLGYFEKASSDEALTFSPLRSELPVSDRYGPPVSFGMSLDGRTLFVSHAYRRAVSAIDVASMRQVDVLDFGAINTPRIDAKTGTQIDDGAAVNGAPVTMRVSSQAGGSVRQRHRTSLVLGDAVTSRMFAVEFDPKFRNFDIVQSVSLSFDATIGEVADPVGRGRGVPLLITSSAGHRRIVVGSPAVHRVVWFTWDKKILDKTGDIKLPSNPMDMTLSSDGETLAVLLDDGGTLAVFGGEPGQAARKQPVKGVSKKVEVAQRLLAELGYPIGAVDAVAGEKTMRALSLFQGDFGLKRSGSIDEPTWSKITYFEEFKAFFEKSGVENFTFNQFLPRSRTERCNDAFEMPEKNLWKNAIELARVIDAFQSRWKGQVYISGAFKSKKYHMCLTSGRPLRDKYLLKHFEFRALDFRSDTGSSEDWAEILREMRHEGKFVGAIAVYQHVIHIELGSENKDWIDVKG